MGTVIRGTRAVSTTAVCLAVRRRAVGPPDITNAVVYPSRMVNVHGVTEEESSKDIDRGPKCQNNRNFLLNVSVTCVGMGSRRQAEGKLKA